VKFYLLVWWGFFLLAYYRRRPVRFTVEKRGHDWTVVDRQTHCYVVALDYEDAAFTAMNCRLGLTKDYTWHS
jgi:hypothetical protein